MKDNNKGFTFVELMVVMAIIVIGITTSYNMYRYLSNANAKKIIETIRSGMNQTRTESMVYGGEMYCELMINNTDGVITTRADGQTYFIIYRQSYTKDGSGNVVWDVDGDGNPVMVMEVCTSIGNEINRIELAIGTETATLDYVNLQPIQISYKRSTGGFDKLTYGTSYAECLSTGTSYGKLKIYTATGDTEELKLYFVTGRIELD